MKKLALMAMAASLVCGVAQAKEKETINITPISQDADAANGGIIYTLPKTMVRVKVEAEVTIKKAGPYYRYSTKLLNLQDVIVEDSKEWKICNVSIDTYGKADNSRMYKISGSTLPSIALTDDNVIKSINDKCCSTEQQNLVNEDTDDELPDITFDNVRLEGNVLSKTSTAAMAEEVAHSIYRLRDKRLSLLGGEESTVLHDEGSYDRVLREIDTLEKEYLSLFVGKTVNFKVVKYFDIEPGALSMSSTVLFRFSNEDGFMGAMDITGKPVYIDLEFGAKPKINSYPEDSKLRKASPVNGLRYIMPGEVTVKVIDRNILLAEKTILCSENGLEATLPLEMITEGYAIKFNTTNGSIISISAKKETTHKEKK